MRIKKIAIYAFPFIAFYVVAFTITMTIAIADRFFIREWFFKFVNPYLFITEYLPDMFTDLYLEPIKRHPIYALLTILFWYCVLRCVACWYRKPCWEYAMGLMALAIYANPIAFTLVFPLMTGLSEISFLG